MYFLVLLVFRVMRVVPPNGNALHRRMAKPAVRVQAPGSAASRIGCPSPGWPGLATLCDPLTGRRPDGILPIIIKREIALQHCAVLHKHENH